MEYTEKEQGKPTWERRGNKCRPQGTEKRIKQRLLNKIKGMSALTEKQT